MSHVLEHLTDPVSYLRKLHDDFLNADGLLLVEVPNLYGHSCFEVAHNFSFTPQTIVEVLRSAGFAAEMLKMHAVTTSKPDRPVYLTVITRSCSDVLAPHRVRRSNPLLIYFRRQIGLRRVGLPGDSPLSLLLNSGRIGARYVTALVQCFKQGDIVIK